MTLGAVLRRLGAILLWVVVAFGLVATALPPFLDRIYYRGPESGHYDTRRFFNPDGEGDTLGVPGGGNRAAFMLRQAAGNDGRPKWPDHVAVTPSRPAARVDGQAMRVTWIGHATALIQTQGLNILTDPVWGRHVGPFGVGPARVAEPGVRLADLPKIDLILVSHDHYDHMDLQTLRRLWERDKPLVVTSLGNDSVIRQAGVPSRAFDWGQGMAIRPGISVVVTRNHHWGSRWMSDRNRALWSSFVVRLPGGNIFFAGDTGPGDLKWPGEAAAFGPVRFALLPIGAFRFAPGQMVTGSHVGPLDSLRVWSRLGRPWAMPIHWGTFRLSFEAYDTPPRMLTGLVRCTGSDPARFAPAQIGVPRDIPPIGVAPPALDDAALDRCAATPEIAQLR